MSLAWYMGIIYQLIRRSLCIFIFRANQFAILHVGHAKASRKQPKFERFASLDEHHQGQFSTGAFDHFCLALDDADYDGFIEKLNRKGISFQTWGHDDIALKQIWILDPNGVRVELNFI